MELDYLSIKEEDVIKAILGFLSSRNYHLTSRTLEKETNIANCNLPDEFQFLRELVLDGDYQELLVLGASLSSRMDFNSNYYRYLVLRQKFIELIYTKSHVFGMKEIGGIEEVVKTLSELESCCPTKDDYTNLCWLLTVPNLNSLEEFRHWTLDMSRAKCFEDLLTCFKYVSSSTSIKVAEPDRLLQLIIKGLLYEYCTEYCQAVASGEKPIFEERVRILDSSHDCYTFNLFCWLQSLPYDVFQKAFHQFHVDVRYKHMPHSSTQKSEDHLQISVNQKTIDHKAGNLPNIASNTEASESSKFVISNNMNNMKMVENGSTVESVNIGEIQKVFASGNQDLISNNKNNSNQCLTRTSIPVVQSVHEDNKDLNIDTDNRDIEDNGENIRIDNKSNLNQDDIHETTEIDLNVQNQDKENREKKDIILGPLINGVRRPVSTTTLEKLSAHSKDENTDNLLWHQKSPDEHKNEDVEYKVQYAAIEMIEDSQAIRSVSFHPHGKLYAVGANSKTLRICKLSNRKSSTMSETQVVFKRTKYHRGSIYCMAWNSDGRILATGSNDKSIKLMHFDQRNCVQVDDEIDLNFHSGTIRELTFVPFKDNLLLSGGAGNGNVNITDVFTQKLVGTLAGHTGNVFTVYAGDNNLVATGGADNTLRLWDLRSERCIDVVVVGESSPASVALSLKYLASGQEDGSILLYDLAAGRTIQNFRLHQQDCRSVRFSPDENWLLTSSYDATISLTHLKDNINDSPPKYFVVARHDDKVIQCRWHPTENLFLSSSADKTAVIWKALS